MKLESGENNKGKSVLMKAINHLFLAMIRKVKCRVGSQYSGDNIVLLGERVSKGTLTL